MSRALKGTFPEKGAVVLGSGGGLGNPLSGFRRGLLNCSFCPFLWCKYSLGGQLQSYQGNSWLTKSLNI